MSIHSIALFTDFSENAEVAFVQALDMARRYETKLRVVHVMHPVMNELMVNGVGVMIPAEVKETLVANIEERMAQLCQRGEKEGVELAFDIIGGHVSTEILRFIEDEKIDLAILGAFGLSGMGLVLFGSVAKRVVHRAPCSVMIVRNRMESEA